MDGKPIKQPKAWISFIPIATLMILLLLTINCFDGDLLGGAGQVILLISTGICSLLAITICHVPWKNIEQAIVNNITSVANALVMLLLIGAMSGAWMVSGVIPTLIYYGLEIMNPNFFLASACIICAFVSFMTGSSWTTIATLGLAFLGIGRMQGFSDGWIAGAIISGAYFGDKMSPMIVSI